MRKIKVSNGELVDKYTILLIKTKFRPGSVEKELKYVEKQFEKIRNLDLKLFCDLREVNEKLWHLENYIRELDSMNKFDDIFIDVARSIYRWNDNRHMIKKKIDEQTGSKFTEFKSLPEY